jgi:hypothetical protein
MAIECCGKERSTRFCPECGKRLVDDPLVELLAHVRKTEKLYRTSAAKAMARSLHSKYDNPGYWSEKADKWQSWVDALSRLMGSDHGE